MTYLSRIIMFLIYFYYSPTKITQEFILTPYFHLRVILIIDIFLMMIVRKRGFKQPKLISDLLCTPNKKSPSFLKNSLTHEREYFLQ